MNVSYDLLIVGAGFSGAVLAERFTRVCGKRSLVIDRQPHIAGNAHDRYDHWCETIAGHIRVREAEQPLSASIPMILVQARNLIIR
ncbi:MAG: NAD(P)-binding protein, partial [Verrucomicrobia bacterium]|nr:NAD(P)-binding protein [Verrucomicrobiota bacterium]